MKKTVYKYPLDSRVWLPKGAEIPSLQTQNNEPFLWALVNPAEKEMQERFFETFGTGHAIRFDMGIERKFIATYQQDGGAYVFHVFERLD